MARIRSLGRGLGRRAEVEAEMEEEFRHHLELRTEDLVRRGLTRREARRRARLEFGHIETHREHARAARGLRPFDRFLFSWLDVKLGFRMLVKHPWLTLAAVFALAVGIPVGLAPAHLANAVEAPLPEDPGNRVRAIRLWDPATSRSGVPGRADFDYWSGQLTTFSTLAAYGTAAYNVAADEGAGAPVSGARVTASAFDVLGRRPLLGRTLDDADERPGAPNVVVIGHDLWTTRFGSDRDIVGRTIRVGAEPHVVVGVMGEGFLFPVHEQLWLPLREEPAGTGRGSPVRVFGRLADGASPENAQAEISAFGRPDLGDVPEAEARLLPEVVPFGMAFTSLPRGGLTSMPEFIYFQLLAWVLLLVACGNVAMLIFARTATRFRELAIRSALGAGRVRLIWQMFVETLILSLLAAGLGVFCTNWALGRINLGALAGEAVLPYWFSLGVTGSAVLWALILAVVSATVAGVIPAIRITGNRIQESIKRAEAGRSGIRFGGVTGALVVADVTIAVAAIGLALTLVGRMLDRPTNEVLAGIPAEEYLAVEVRMPAADTRGRAAEESARTIQRQAAIQLALVERLLAEPDVRSVAVADALPRMDPRARAFEVEGVDRSADAPPRYVRTVRADVDFLDALGTSVMAGRDFDRGDLESEAHGVIVNTVFAERELGGGDPLARRLRFPAASGEDEPPWHPIVGVVGHLGTDMVSPQGGPAIYVPAAPGTLGQAQLGIHVGPSPERIAPRLREIAAAVDPNLILGTPVVLSDVYQGDWYVMVAMAGGLTLLVGVLVALAISGIYGMMSFSVSERTREIGIRAALGATKGVLVATILRRTLIQLGLGAALGATLAGRLFSQLGDPAGGTRSPLVAFLTAVGLALAIVLFIGLVSCLVPTRRIVRVEASEALRAEG